jgi:hypothetical protein
LYKSRYSYSCWDKRTCFALIYNPDCPDFEFTASKDPLIPGQRCCKVYGEKNEKARSICEMIGTLDSTTDNDITANYYLLK